MRGGVEAQQLGQLGAVRGVLVDAQLEVLRKGGVELGVLVLVLRKGREHLEALLDEVLAHHAHDLGLLQRLARDVQRQVVRVDDAPDEGEVLGQQLLGLVRDEDAAHVQADVRALLPVAAAVEHVEGRARGREEQRLELQLPLHGEVLHGAVRLPVVGHGLVERGVLLGRHLVRRPHPQGLGRVQVLPVVRHLLHRFGG